MQIEINERVALLAGLSIALMTSAWPSAANAAYPAAWMFGNTSGYEPPQLAKKVEKARRAKKTKGSKKDPEAKAAGTAIPAGQLQIVVSIDYQRATFYADGSPVAHSAISTGTRGHPTPMGVFSVIQKNRHHVSNLYGAKMPYMQRLTWSGTALHTGPLPGYLASHGCIRLTNEFAQLLWTTTKIGARVIVTRSDAAPVAFEHPRLFSSLLKPAEPVAATIKTASASGAAETVCISNAPANGEAAATPVSPEELAKPTETIASKQAPRVASQISVFVSRKDKKLYVWQAMQPLFDTPVTIRQPDQPLGTHVYTAMGAKDGGADMRWTVVSIPSSYTREAEPRSKKSEDKKKPRNERAIKAVAAEPQPTLPGADAALERIEIPQEAAGRIAELLLPGSSLIVSANGISGETGKGTDFIVLTR